ncbi:MAG TPA: AAA family ATPase [Myxococcota bacterium]|nr:AAA family ATPase [Myxococcota bacterium]
MAVRYDDALPRLVRLCESQPHFGAVERACVVRDLRGQLRLVCEARPASVEPDWEDLARVLTDQLQGWFAGPILRPSSPRLEEARTARHLLQQAEPWPEGWPGGEPDALGGPSQIPDRWCALRRVLAKEAWLDAGPAAPPWPLLPSRRPVLVSFHSFKGGVGRTTALVLAARQLAAAGHGVLLVDLDLEAPGLAPLLGVDPEAGVIDALLQHAATGRLDTDGLVQEVDARGVPLHVISAGRLGWSHLEKLARLDYLHTGGHAHSPVEAALHELLRRVRVTERAPDGTSQAVQPGLILIDARAGLHDLAGLALHGLAHVDVLVSRANEQSRQGLDLTLRALGRRCPDARLVLVQTFVPENGREAAIEAWRSELYRMLKTHFYDRSASDADDVGIADAHAPHHAVAVPDLGATGAPPDLASANEVLLGHTVWRELARRIWEQTS